MAVLVFTMCEECGCAGESVDDIHHFDYGDRLDRLGLFSLDCRRLKSDLIDVCKIIRIIYMQNHFPMARGHRFVRGSGFKGVLRGRMFFTQEVVNI